MKQPLLILIAVLVTVSLLLSCEEEKQENETASFTLAFEVPARLESTWHEIRAGGELPGNIAVTEQTHKADGIIALKRKGWNSKDTSNSRQQSEPSRTAKKLSKTVARKWFAPSVLLWEEDPGYSLEDIFQKDIPVSPLSEITLPRRAVPVDTHYPDDERYPLTSTTILTMSSRTGKLLPEALKQWFHAVPEWREQPRITWIGAVGDIMPGRGVDTLLMNSSEGVEQVFGNTLTHLQSFDLLLGNLETAVTVSGEPLPKSYTFRVHPETLHALGRAGFDYLSLCNNHCYDFGEEGFLETLHNLEAAALATSGAGKTPEQASRVYRHPIHGEPINVLSLGAYPEENNGFNGMRQARVSQERAGILWADEFGLTALEEQFEEAAFNVVMVHGGQEWSIYPSSFQKELYTSFIDRGADLVIGSHPHVLQGMQAYKNKLIAYSLGNFIFPGMEETRYGEDSMILALGVIDGTIKYIRYIPVSISSRHLSVATDNTIKKRFLSLTRKLDPDSTSR
jgi:poly-gamma-glutamate synthesis protein (capsule biosynthesis protein)